MKLVGRIPVEPLDDERLTNIERRVVAGAVDAAPRNPARAPRRHLGFAAAAMAAMITGVIGWKLGAGTTASPIVAEPAPIHVTTDTQRSSLDIGDATIQSDPSTAFVVTRPSGGVLVELTHGRVELEVAKRANRPPLVVRAGDTDVIVVGTHFTVDCGHGTGDVDVRVTEGVVQIVRHNQRFRVTSGTAWKTQRGVIAPADAGPALTVPAVTGNAAAGTRVPPPHTTNAGSNAKSQTADHTAPHTANDPTLDLRALIAQQTVEPAMDVGLPPEKAVSEYRSIVIKMKGDDASRAFYSIAVVQAMKLGRTGDALQTLDQYMRRFAGGKEYTAALWLRVRILCGRVIDEKCREAAYTFVHQAPDSPAAHVAERITISE